MITELARNLRLDIEPLAWPHKVYDYGRSRHVRVPLGDISPELVAWLDHLSLKIEWVELFYTAPGQITKIHTDGLGGDYTKLNWQYGGQSSVMRWYRPLRQGHKDPLITPIDSDYLFWSAMEVEPVGDVRVGYPTLVQVGVPHNVVNLLTHRWVLSVIILDKTRGRRLTWAEALDRFNPQLV